MFKPGLEEEQLQERSLVLQKDLTVSDQEEMEGRDKDSAAEAFRSTHSPQLADVSPQSAFPGV